MKDKGILLLVISLGILAIPSAVFMLNSRGYGWDTIGHIAEADFYKAELAPGIYGWNSYFLFGYPFHLYPPLSRIVMAFLFGFFGFALASNLALVAFCMLTLVAVFVFLRNYGYKKEISGAVCVMAAVYMSTTALDRDFTVANAFHLGMIGNFMALPLFFFALAYFDRNLRLSALFSAIVVLTNMAIAIMLMLSLFALVLLRISRFGLKDAIPRCIYLSAAVFCLSAFWLWPFASYMLLQNAKAVFDVPFSVSNIMRISMIGLASSAAVAYVAFNGKKLPKSAPQYACLLYTSPSPRDS